MQSLACTWRLLSCHLTAKLIGGSRCRASEVSLQLAAAGCALAFVAHTAWDWGIIAGTWARPARSMAVTVTFTAISVMLLAHLAILLVFAATQGPGWQVGHTC